MAVIIFVVTYAVIVSERVHKTTAALAGAMAMIAFKVIDAEQAWEAIDLNVIFLLAGMMIIANTMASTGVFQWLAIRAAKVAGGSPFGVLVILCAVTATFSAFLDNVTTVVLIAPVALVVARALEVRPEPGLVAIALASNIGGTSTLIGDPPNILIASHANIDFMTFLVHVGPAAVLSLVAFLVVLALVARWREPTNETQRRRIMSMDDQGLITDLRLLRISVAVLAATIVGFLLQGVLGYEPAAIALMGGVLILLITRNDPHHELMQVEWTTLFFFIGLFIVVGGLEHTGVLQDVGRSAVELTRGSVEASTFLVLWMSALLSGVVDNIPYTATMLPVLDELNRSLNQAGHPRNITWWALTLGADLGGNLTVIGASANVLVANIAERSGHPISFAEFFRWGLATTIGTVVISSAYLWLRYMAF
ncbi:MAG: ArsB/NhaD family transporter [Chloroflexi bacterium]|nr:ArsB/NhaD family transporter [Chloroflexota bacterium]